MTRHDQLRAYISTVMEDVRAGRVASFDDAIRADLAALGTDMAAFGVTKAAGAIEQALHGVVGRALGWLSPKPVTDPARAEVAKKLMQAGKR